MADISNCFVHDIIPDDQIRYQINHKLNQMCIRDRVYTEGGDSLYVMDQISDKKNKEENWVESISLRAVSYTNLDVYKRQLIERILLQIIIIILQDFFS